MRRYQILMGDVCLPVESFMHGWSTGRSLCRGNTTEAELVDTQTYPHKTILRWERSKCDS